MDYNARFYDPMLGRFTSPDSIIPDAGSVIGYNQFAYVNNNPMNYTDPSGHCINADGSINWNSSNGPFGTSGLCNVDTSTVDPILGNPVSPDITDPGGIASTTGQDTGSAQTQTTEEIVGNLAFITQDVATFFSDVGGVVEIFFTGAGCIDAGGAGCVVGFLIGNTIHKGTTNILESGFSKMSLGFSLWHNYLAGDLDLSENVEGVPILTIDEASATNVWSAVIGEFSPSGVADAMIDHYGSAYNRGNVPGVYEIYESSGVVSIYDTTIVIPSDKNEPLLIIHFSD